VDEKVLLKKGVRKVFLLVQPHPTRKIPAFSRPRRAFLETPFLDTHPMDLNALKKSLERHGLPPVFRSPARTFPCQRFTVALTGSDA